jgi:chromosome segregation ATPase
MAEEENLKLKFLDLEKKFVELEMNVSKINESLKKLEATKLNEVLERFEEIEDLVMIENAAVVELKELLEASNTDEIKKDLEAVKKDFEEKINNINSTLSSSLNEIKENIAKISSDTEKIKELEQRIEKVELSLAFIPKIIEEGDLIEGLGKIVKTHDETIESIKRELEEIRGLKEKIEEELNKRIPSSLLEDFVKLGNELSLLKVNVSSLSKQLDEIYRDVKLLKPEMIREAISRMTELKVETEERVKEVNDLVASISSQKEDIKKIGLIEARINDVSKQINSFLAEIEFLKGSLSNFSSKKDLEKLKEEISGISSDLLAIKEQLVKKSEFDTFQKDFSSIKDETLNLRSSLDKLTLEINIINNSIQALVSRLNKMEEIKNSLQLFSTKEELEVINNKIVEIMKIVETLKEETIKKEEYTNIRKEIETIRGELSKREEVENLKEELSRIKSEITNITKNIQDMSNKIKENGDFVSRRDVESLMKKFVNVEDFSALLLDFKRLQQEFDKSKHDLMNSATRDEIQSLMKEVSALRGEIEGIKKEIIQPTIIQQIVNKITLLEAKIGEMEKRLETKIKPIILE